MELAKLLLAYPDTPGVLPRDQLQTGFSLAARCGTPRVREVPPLERRGLGSRVTVSGHRLLGGTTSRRSTPPGKVSRIPAPGRRDGTIRIRLRHVLSVSRSVAEPDRHRGPDLTIVLQNKFYPAQGAFFIARRSGARSAESHRAYLLAGWFVDARSRSAPRRLVGLQLTVTIVGRTRALVGLVRGAGRHAGVGIVGRRTGGLARAGLVVALGHVGVGVGDLATLDDTLESDGHVVPDTLPEGHGLRSCVHLC